MIRKNVYLWPLVLGGLFASPALAQDAAPAEENSAEEAQQAPVPSRFGARPIDEAYGAFQRGLYLTARNLAMPRAEEGDAAAQTLLAEIYARGLAVPRDVEKAEFWYKKAAAQGVPEAQFQYALTLLKREGDDPDQRQEATQLMKAAADGGNGKAQFNYAQLILDEKPGTTGRKEAFDYFKLAAERNIPDAQYALAQYYLTGSADVEIDEEEARKWMEKSARLNFDTAQLDLGNFYLSGVGGVRDLERGFGWIERAARGGNIAAQAVLAKLYWGGIGTEPDTVEAAAWYVLARRAGLRDRVLEDFWEGISGETQQAAIEKANRLQ